MDGEWVRATSDPTGENSIFADTITESWQSGRMRWSWKPLYSNVPGVRIPHSPQQNKKTHFFKWVFFILVLSLKN